MVRLLSCVFYRHFLKTTIFMMSPTYSYETRFSEIVCVFRAAQLHRLSNLVAFYPVSINLTTLHRKILQVSSGRLYVILLPKISVVFTIQFRFFSATSELGFNSISNFQNMLINTNGFCYTLHDRQISIKLTLE